MKGDMTGLGYDQARREGKLIAVHSVVVASTYIRFPGKFCEDTDALGEIAVLCMPPRCATLDKDGQVEWLSGPQVGYASDFGFESQRGGNTTVLCTMHLLPQVVAIVEDHKRTSFAQVNIVGQGECIDRIVLWKSWAKIENYLEWRKVRLDPLCVLAEASARAGEDEYIYANRAGLEALRDAIDQVLATSLATEIVVRHDTRLNKLKIVPSDHKDFECGRD